MSLRNRMLTLLSNPHLLRASMLTLTLVLGVIWGSAHSMRPDGFGLGG
jgi:hypothetical protein